MINTVPENALIQMCGGGGIGRPKGRKRRSLKCILIELYIEELLQFSLTQNLSCAIIISVEIEKTCSLVRTGRNYKGSGKISTRRD